MRTNIDIDDDVLDAAMKAGSFKTKKDAVEAGLRLIARQEAYREILKWRGRLHWEGEAWSDALPAATEAAAPPTASPAVAAPAAPASATPTGTRRGRR